MSLPLLLDRPEKLYLLRDKFESVSRFGMDYETDSRFEGLHDKHGLEHDLLKVVGVGFGFEDGTKTYVPLAHRYSDNVSRSDFLPLLEKVLTDPSKELFAHNLKFEYMVSRVLGITPQNKLRCSQIAQWLLGYRLDKGRGLKLKPAVQRFLKHKMLTMEDVVPKGVRLDSVQSNFMARYCADDALQCLMLALKFFPELQEKRLWDVYERMEMPFVPVLVHMKECGIALDTEYLQQLCDVFQTEIDKIEAEFLELTGVGVSKNQQISKRMYEDLRWWPCRSFRGEFERGKAGFYSVDKAHLEIVAKQLEEGSDAMRALRLKQRYQSVSKLNSTYTLPLIKKAAMHIDGRLRGDFHQTGTETGRLASSDPNLQNIPARTAEGKQIRDAFVAADGWVLCDADYSQADLVMMAHLSQDPMLMAAYREKRDLHQQTADRCSTASGLEVVRPTGKVLNLGLIYEMQVYTLMNNLKCEESVAQRIWDAWHETYPLVSAYHRRMHAFARKYGFVRTITGRMRLIPDINSRNGKKRSFAERCASNTPDQGSVADMIKLAMRNLFQEWRERGILYDYYTKEGKAKILSQVHDEIICELKCGFEEEGMADIRRHLENAVELRVPMTAQPGIGHTWNQAKADVGRREDLAAEAEKETDAARKAELFRQVMAYDYS